jgi:hypothetical protein
MGIVIDSPIGRALGRRIEGAEPQVAQPVADLVKRLEVLEGEVEELHGHIRQLLRLRLAKRGPHRPPCSWRPGSS